jgi:hypothetical protein
MLVRQNAPGSRSKQPRNTQQKYGSTSRRRVVEEAFKVIFDESCTPLCAPGRKYSSSGRDVPKTHRDETGGASRILIRLTAHPGRAEKSYLI